MLTTSLQVWSESGQDPSDSAHLTVVLFVQTTCVAFSSLAPQVMAAGTSSGEVLIYDISNPTAPTTGKGDATLSVYKPDQRRSGDAQALCVQFNNQTERIVAIGYSNGHTHVRS
jgi:hypothetical protein